MSEAEVELRISAADVLQALEAEEIPESSRRNVRQLGDSAPALGMCLGLTCHWVNGFTMSKRTREHQSLATLLCRFARQELPAGTTFTSIQVNKDYRSALHVDKNNLGPSWIIGLGDYEGGRLWVHDGSDMGHAADIRGRWFAFDGNSPHCVLPFRGRRYTLVFFTFDHRRLSADAELPEGMRQKLLAVGFPLPLLGSPQLERGRYNNRAAQANEAAMRLRVGTDAFRRFSEQVVRRGGISNTVLRVRDEAGRVLWVSVPPKKPLRHLSAALRQRLRSTRKLSTSSSVLLSLGTLRLLPGDSVHSLGLSARHILDMRVVKARSSQN